MGSTLAGIDVVDKGEKGLIIPIVVLESNFHLDIVFLRIKIDRLRVYSFLGCVQMGDEGLDAPFEMEFLESGFSTPLIANGYDDALV
jgi:hypothetical protein